MSAKIIIVEKDALRPQPGHRGEVAYSWTIVHGDNQQLTGEEEHRTFLDSANKANEQLERLRSVAADQRRKAQAAHA